MDDLGNNNIYNFIFDKMVEGENDFVGSLAYILYKRNKIDFIKQYTRTHGSEPDLKTLRVWQCGECTELKLANYKKLAQQKATDFVNNLQVDKDKALAKQKKELEKREKMINKRDEFCHVKVKGQFGMGILQSLVASFLFVVLCVILILVINGYTDVVGLAKTALGR